MLFKIVFRERGRSKHRVVQIAELHAGGYREAQAEARRMYPDLADCSVSAKELAPSWQPAPPPK